jgi:hypothetical protein
MPKNPTLPIIVESQSERQNFIRQMKQMGPGSALNGGFFVNTVDAIN